jgi:hypothetical protein
VRQCHAVSGIEPFALRVWSAMSDGVAHRTQSFRLSGRRLRRVESSYAAHCELLGLSSSDAHGLYPRLLLDRLVHLRARASLPQQFRTRAAFPVEPDVTGATLMRASQSAGRRLP